MRIERTHGTLVIRFGERFAAPEVDRASSAILATSPLSQVTLDFRDVKHLDLAAILPLVEALEPLQGVRTAFRGLTRHQARVLEYLGIRLGAPHRDDGTAQVHGARRVAQREVRAVPGAGTRAPTATRREGGDGRVHKVAAQMPGEAGQLPGRKLRP